MQPAGGPGTSPPTAIEMQGRAESRRCRGAVRARPRGAHEFGLAMWLPWPHSCYVSTFGI
eukprot:5343372-Prymnesium_polylepis.1